MRVHTCPCVYVNMYVNFYISTFKHTCSCYVCYWHDKQHIQASTHCHVGVRSYKCLRYRIYQLQKANTEYKTSDFIIDKVTVLALSEVLEMGHLSYPVLDCLLSILDSVL